MSGLLEVEDLHTCFSTRRGLLRAVDGVSFTVDEGETLGLVGESGCGKSATALSIMRLIPEPHGKITSGRVRFDGRDLLGLSRNDMRKVRGRKIAMIFQEPMTSLNPVLTIGRQIMETVKVHLGLGNHDARRKAVELLKVVQIPDPEMRLSQYPHQFSGGMRQRVMLAMALSCDPKLILADEPTTALDVTVQAEILDMMKDLTVRAGMALVLITHNLGIVARYADRVNVMYAGKIVEESPVHELFNDPRDPYTSGLLGCVPRIDMELSDHLSPIEGHPPDLVNLPPGCSYYPRCPHAAQRCLEAAPDLISVGDWHASACWFAENLRLTAQGAHHAR